MSDLYTVLGLQRDADAKGIKSAYRKLAKQYHPDLNPGDAKLAEKFREIGHAYAILGDEEKRAAYDRGELDSEGNPSAPRGQRHYYRDFAEQPEGGRYSRTQHRFDPEDISDLFSSFFHGGMGGQQAGFKRRDLDAHYQIRIDFLDAARGAQKHLTLPDGKVLDVAIPAGVEDGQKLRLKGQGAALGAERGDAYLELHILPHPYFHREGKDIVLNLPVDLATAVLGGKLEVPTVHGKVLLGIPANSSSGRVLRLKGKGIAGGDQRVVLSIQLPKEPDAALEAALKDWAANHAYQPETSWGGKA